MKWPITKQKNNSRGSILLSLIITMPFLILITSTYLSLSVNSYKISRSDQFQTHAQFAADAGIDYAVQQINQDSTWPGTVTPVTLHSSTDVTTKYSITVTAVGSKKVVTSVGQTFWPASSSTPDATVTVVAELRSVASGNYSIVTGVGGLIMENSSRVLGGDVFINGELSMKNTAQIGLTISPTNLFVAHQNCPAGSNPGPTYPRVCLAGENGQPISMQNSSHIYGVVKANNQTNGSGMSNTGLQTPHCLQPAPGINCVAPQPLPTHDRATQTAAALTPVAPYNTNWSCNSGTHTWPANLKITGNVTISNGCSVIVSGNVWITGNFTMSNTSTLTVADALGTTKPDIMVDGSSGISLQNSAVLRPNVVNTGFQMITYWSASACSPNCPSVIGTDLYNSRHQVTIDLKNSASADKTIFYARWSQVSIENTGQIGALVGQTILLKNSGTITFGTSVGTGTSFWIIDGYRRTF